MWRTRVIKKQLAAAVVATGLVAGAFAGPRASAATLGAAGAGTNPNCTTASAVANWPLSRRLAQLVMVDLNFGDPTAANYAAAGAGGFVFLGQPPAGSGPAIAAQMQGLNATEAAAGLTKPLLSTDEEGGGVARLSNVIGALPWQRQQAAMWSPAGAAIDAGGPRRRPRLGRHQHGSGAGPRHRAGRRHHRRRGAPLL